MIHSKIRSLKVVAGLASLAADKFLRENTRTVKMAGWCALACAILWCLYLPWRNEHSLSLNSTRITTLWRHVHDYEPYPVWISNHEAIYVQVGLTARFEKVDTDTGKQSPMAELNARFANVLADAVKDTDTSLATYAPPALLMSPSRKSLLIAPSRVYQHPGAMVRRTERVHADIYVTDLAAKSVQHWHDQVQQDAPTAWAWQPDGVSFASAEYDGAYDGPAETVHLYAAATAPRVICSQHNNARPRGWIADDGTQRGTLWGMANPATIGHLRIYISEWQFEGSSAPAIHTVTLPFSGYVNSFRVSPSRTRVAWSIISYESGPLTRILHRVFPKMAIRTSLVYSLWVSDLLGQHMVEVAREVNPQTIFDVKHIQWLPDEGTLSFMSRDDLYTIPVPR